MKPPPFEYHVVESVEEALGLLSEFGDEAKVLAGGQSLVPLLSLRLARPENLIDINGVGGLGRVESHDGLRLGALVRHRTVERDERITKANPLLSSAARFIGHAAIRNRGTMGGTIGHADPAAEMPTVAVALDGEIEASRAGSTRTIPAADFFQGFLTTALEPGEMVTAVQFPEWKQGAGWSFQEFSRRSGDFAMAGAAVMLSVGDDGLIDDARICLSGMSEVPARGRLAEASLIGRQPSEEAWTEAAADAVNGLEPPADLHGSSAYRLFLASNLVKAGLREAFQRAEVPA